MKRSLYVKFLIVYLFFSTLTAFFISSLSHRYAARVLRERQAEALYEQAVTIASVYGKSYYNNPLIQSSLKPILSFLSSYLSSTIWIMDDNGRVLLSSNMESDEANTVVIPDFDPTDTDTKNYMIGDFYGYFQEEQLTVVTAIISDFEIRGYVVIHMPTEQIDQLTASTKLPYSIILLSAFGLFMLLFLFFAFLVLRPIHKQELATKTTAEAQDFQRKFVANISHDFRSPLTSIKGYAQAMADGTIPTEAMEKYLNIIVSETERLHQLTENLLALHRYDTADIGLELSSFDINQILKDTGALFEGRCMERKISLSLLLSGKNLMVTADCGKIQQVIYNLVDNAIKFSHPNSTIELETTEKNETVLISVKDSGIGIPKDALPHIWDRFYKTDLSRGKDKHGSGLGLSIIQEILQAHGETIEVTSTEGVGSKFTFTLPKSWE